MTDIFSKIKSGSLDDLLAVCSKEDLEPLVGYISDKRWNSFKSNEAFKTYSPADHTKYTKLIADKIRLFGGNTLRNVTRSGEGPEYDDILLDACQKLDIPSKKGDIFNNESNLLRLFIPGWEYFSPDDRYEAVERARDECGAKAVLSNITTTIFSAAIRNVAAVGVVLKAKGVTDTTFDVTSPCVIHIAYHVTIPCVIHIAYLRWKVLRYMQEYNIKNSLKIANSNTTSNSQLIVKRGSPLIIGEVEDRPVLTFSWVEVSELTPIKWQVVSDLNESGISHFNSLLQALPNVVTQAHVASTQYVEVNIPIDLLAKVKDKVGKYRGWVQDSDSKIKEHAELSAPEKLRKIVTIAALWQITSVIVAQKYLVDIDKKLVDIDKKLDVIKDDVKAILSHLNIDEPLSKIQGVIEYFNQIAPAIKAGELRDAYEQKIEDFESELIEIEKSLFKNVKKLNEEIGNLNDGAMKGMENAIKTHQNELLNLYKLLFLCIKARAFGWQLLLAFPGTEESAKSRIHFISTSLAKLNVNSELVSKTITDINIKIHSLSSDSNKALTIVSNQALKINEGKLALLKLQDTFVEEMTNDRLEIDRNIRSVESLVQDNHRVTKVLLKIEEGKVVASSAM